MKERISVLTYKYRISILFFMFMFLILSLAPLSGDVIDNYLIKDYKIIDVLKGSFSSFLISFFSHNKLIFNLVFSFLFALFINNSNSIIKEIRNKNFYLFMVIVVLAVGYLTFSYNYMSIEGVVLYTIPSLLIFLYFINFSKNEKDYRKLILFLFLSIVIINLNIVLGISFFIANIIYLLINKKMDNKTKLIFIVVQLINIISIIGIKNINFNFVITDYINIKDNISSTIKNLFSNNILLFVLGAIPINFYLKTQLKSNMYRRIKIFLFNVPLIFSLIYNFGNYFPVNIDLILTRYSGFFAVENYYYIGYFLVYFYFLIRSIKHFVKDRNILIFLNAFQLISIILFVLSIFTKDFQSPVFIFVIFNICLTTFILLTEIRVKIYPRLTILLASLIFIYYILSFLTIRIIENKRIDYINKQLDEKKEKIIIMANPIRLIVDSNPKEENFDLIKEYYNIPKEKIIYVEYVGIFKKIESKVK